MTMAISKAVEDGAKVVVCASTGNTSASAAAYAARAGLLVRGRHPRGPHRVGQARAGADPRRAGRAGPRQLRRRARRSCASWASAPASTVVNSINPFRIEGQKTAAFEIVDVLGDAPDVHCIPVGNAGNITAYWKGYSEYARARRREPRHAAHARLAGGGRGAARARRAGAAPRDASPPRSGSATRRRGTAPSPRATSRAAHIGAVTDAQILDAYRLLAADEGVFVEPASAASVAGLLQAAADGLLAPDDVVVCTVTGHGLKDPERAIAEVQVGDAIEATAARVAAALDLA